jgi:predicted transcriptional regulator
MINQIETGRCKPSYETAVKIFETLNNMELASSLRTGEVCSRSIVTASPNDTAIDVADQLRNTGFSQLPVMDGSKLVGLISEDEIIKLMLSNTNVDLKSVHVRAIMQPPPPLVHSSTPVKALVQLVRFSKAVLVTEENRVVGIVTASDILKLAGEA